MSQQVHAAVEPAVKWFLALVVAVVATPIIASTWTIWHEWRAGVGLEWYITVAAITLMGVLLTLAEEADAKAPGISTGGFFTGVALTVVMAITAVTLCAAFFTKLSLGDAWSISARFWWGGVAVIATSCAVWVVEKVRMSWLGPRT